MERRLEPELLDSLPPEDPGAVRSRADLRRLNALMGHASIMARVLCSVLRDGSTDQRPRRFVDLGAGDGRFLLSVARRLGREWAETRAILLDRHPVVARETQAAFKQLGWSVEIVTADVFDWLPQLNGEDKGAFVANLFLHHFSDTDLAKLLELSATHSQCLVALEPRRSARAWFGSWSLGLLGCNRVTRHDALVSVRAGFARTELSDLWPPRGGWRLEEKPVGLFSHLFVAGK
jgi:hypothetical protein